MKNTIKYYSKSGELLTSPHCASKKDFAAKFPDHPAKYQEGGYWFGYGVNGIQPVDRVIYYKKQPSLHKCDARCLNATGHNCECSCGGANHGASC